MRWLKLKLTWQERRELLSTQLRSAALAIPTVALIVWCLPASLEGDGWWAVASYRVSTVGLSLWFQAALASALVPLLGLAIGDRRAVWMGLPLPLLALLAWLPLPPLTGAPAATSPSLRVATVNVWCNQRQHEAMGAELRRIDADVLCFQELTQGWNRSLLAAIGDRYPHRQLALRNGSFGTGVYSRLPLVEAETLLLTEEQLPVIRVVVEVGGERWAIYSVHLAPPLFDESVRRQRRQLRELLPLLAAEPLPALVGGDFNWGALTAGDDRVQALGYRDAHELIGRGRGATWPCMGKMRHLPGLRLDHIYARGLVPSSLELGDPARSDHRPLIARYHRQEATGD